MVKKYLIWPLRFFLYISALFLIIFYSFLFILSINEVNKKVLDSFYGNSLFYGGLEVKPGFFGINLKITDLEFTNENLSLNSQYLFAKTNLLSSLLTRTIFIDSVELEGAIISLKNQTDSPRTLRKVLVRDVRLKKVSVGRYIFEELNLKDLVSERGEYGFSFEGLAVDFPTPLKKLSNLSGSGLYSDRKLSFLIDSERLNLSISGFSKSLSLDNAIGAFDLDFSDRFKIPFGRLQSKNEKDHLNLIFSFDSAFNMKLFFKGDSSVALNLLPDSTEDLRYFLVERNFSSDSSFVHLDLSVIKNKILFDSSIFLKNYQISLSDQTFFGDFMHANANNQNFTLFSNNLFTENNEFEKIELSRKFSSEEYSVSLELLNENLIFQYNPQGIISKMYWTNNGDLGHLSINNNDILIKFKDYKDFYLHLDNPDHIRFFDGILSAENFKIDTSLFKQNIDEISSLSFDLSNLEIIDLNSSFRFTENDIFSTNNISFDKLDFTLNDGFISLGDTFDYGGNLSLIGKDISYDEEAFNPGALRVLSLIDVRANLLDFINLDFDKFNENNFLIDSMKGSISVRSKENIDINKIDLSFGTSEAVIEGSIGTTDNRLDTLDLDLIFLSNISQNIPWYFAIIGGIPAAAGAAIVTEILDAEIENISSTKYNISGNVNDIKIDVKQ